MQKTIPELGEVTIIRTVYYKYDSKSQITLNCESNRWPVKKILTNPATLNSPNTNKKYVNTMPESEVSQLFKKGPNNTKIVIKHVMMV